MMQKNKMGVAGCCIVTDPSWLSRLGFRFLELLKEEEGLDSAMGSGAVWISGRV